MVASGRYNRQWEKEQEDCFPRLREAPESIQEAVHDEGTVL